MGFPVLIFHQPYQRKPPVLIFLSTARLDSIVVPILSYTTSTPVGHIFKTFFSQSSLYKKTVSAPRESAICFLLSDETKPITSAPSILQTCISNCPTPPAAASMSTVSPCFIL